MRPLLAFMVTSASVLAACATPPAPEAPSATADPSRRVTFVCDRSDRLTVTFSPGQGILEGDGQVVTLTQQTVASGLHYSGGGHDLRGKGTELTWTKPSGEVRACRDQEWAMRQPQIQEPRRTLAGTSWTLIHFQSSDDAIGAVIPPRADQYRITFEAGGALSLQLDCNRATGRWEAKSTAPGALMMTGGAMTRAFCGPGALDAQLARDVSRIRSYTFAGEKLGLALEADGGVYLWRPATGN